jgi:glycosyltransferase involved in cell wall biosynthesis
VRISFLSWRDTGHPDGGGSELFVEQVAQRLAAQGHQVTLVCARYPGSARDSTENGVHVRRRGGRLTVYPHGLLFLLSRRGRRQDVVIEVINGLPFGARLVRRRGLLALVHHVHRRQWELIYPGLRGRIGWFVESRLTPALYRSVPHLTVSEASRRDLVALGIREVSVVHNGLDASPVDTSRSTHPRLVLVARLVPHKQVEHALDALAVLRQEFPELHLDLVGDGWWHDELLAHAARLGLDRELTWHGHVTERRRDELLAGAWVALMPSVKEGWGLAVVEAAAQGTPTIAYREAGGVAESILDGRTGVLVEGPGELIEATRELLCSPELRSRMGLAARSHAATFSWDDATAEVIGFVRRQVAPANGVG